MSFFSQVKQLIYDAVSELWVSAPGDAANGLDVDVTRLPENGATGANASATLRGYDSGSDAFTDVGTTGDRLNTAALLMLDVGGTPRLVTGIDISGDGGPYVFQAITIGLTTAETALDSTPPVIVGTEQRETPVDLEADDGFAHRMISDETGRLHVNSKLPIVDADYGVHAFVGIRGHDGDGGYGEALVQNGTLLVSLGGNAIYVNAHDVYAYDQSDAIQAAGGAKTPKFAVIAAASSGNNTLVSAVAEKKIRVLALTLSASGAVNAKFQSAAGGTDKTGLYYLTTNSQLVLPYNKLGWFETAASALLNLSLSGAVAVGGCLTYIEVG